MIVDRSRDPRASLSTINSQPSTLLLIKPGSLGDVVHALPVAAALHHAWPQARLSWVIDPRWESVLEGNTAIAERIPFAREKYRGLRGATQAARWLASLRDHRPDLAIDLQGLFRSALIAKASRPIRIIGLADAREGATSFYDEAAPVTNSQHAVDRYLSILPLLGLEIPAHPEFSLPTSHPSPVTSHPADSILLHPYARGAGKSLTEAQITGLCERLAPAPVILAGLGTAPASLPANVRDLTNRTTILELITLLRDSQSVISVDSGPMHLAAAVGVRLLSIHTWSDPRRVGPYSSKAWIWQGGELRPQRLDIAPRPERPLTPRDLDTIAAWATGNAWGSIGWPSAVFASLRLQPVPRGLQPRNRARSDLKHRKPLPLPAIRTTLTPKFPRFVKFVPSCAEFAEA